MLMGIFVRSKLLTRTLSFTLTHLHRIPTVPVPLLSTRSVVYIRLRTFNADASQKFSGLWSYIKVCICT